MILNQFQTPAMKSKKITMLGLVCLLVYSMACNSSDYRKAEFKKLQNGKEVVGYLDQLMSKLNSQLENSEENMDSIVAINENIRSTIEWITSPALLEEIGESLEKGNHNIRFVLSNDTNFGVFSWDTGLNALGTPLKNIAIYNSGNKLEPTSLYGTPINYNEIHQITMKTGEIIYVLEGSEELKSSKRTTLYSYLIRKGQLEEAFIFPNRESRYFMDSQTDTTTIDVSMDHNELTFQENSSIDNPKSVLAFNGKKFVPVVLQGPSLTQTH